MRSPTSSKTAVNTEAEPQQGSADIEAAETGNVEAVNAGNIKAARSSGNLANGKIDWPKRNIKPNMKYYGPDWVTEIRLAGRST